MRFNPSTKITNNGNLLPDGDYDFEVVHATDKTSSQGNDMMVLKLRAGSDGASRTIIDYIVAKNIRKVRAVAKACGLIELFESGEILAESFVGRRGRLRLETEKSVHPDFPDRNVVACYLAPRR